MPALIAGRGHSACLARTLPVLHMPFCYCRARGQRRAGSAGLSPRLRHLSARRTLCLQGCQSARVVSAAPWRQWRVVHEELLVPRLILVWVQISGGAAPGIRSTPPWGEGCAEIDSTAEDTWPIRCRLYCRCCPYVSPPLRPRIPLDAEKPPCAARLPVVAKGLPFALD